jgi:mono/diheme cytochrome c family protein
MIRLLPALILAATACLAADRKTPPWEKSRHLGQDLYREHCVVCHDLDGKKTKKPGPSLHRLFKNEKLPFSGGKPSRDYVVVKIKFGGDLMPPFIKRMTDAEIAVLVDYIERK